jgi:hypothetical protein
MIVPPSDAATVATTGCGGTAVLTGALPRTAASSSAVVLEYIMSPTRAFIDSVSGS